MHLLPLLMTIKVWILFIVTNVTFIGAMTFLITKTSTEIIRTDRLNENTTIRESITRRHLSILEIAYRQFEYVISITLGQGSWLLTMQ